MPLPTSLLTFPDNRESLTHEDLFLKILDEGKPVVLCGLALIRGDQVVHSMIIVEKDGALMRGWSVYRGHPQQEMNTPCFMDQKKGKTAHAALPNFMVYLIAEVNDPSYVSEDLAPEELDKFVEHVIATYIHD